MQRFGITIQYTGPQLSHQINIIQRGTPHQYNNNKYKHRFLTFPYKFIYRFWYCPNLYGIFLLVPASSPK